MAGFDFCSAGLQPGNCLESKTSEADTPKVKIMCVFFWGKDELEENKKTHQEWWNCVTLTPSVPRCVEKLFLFLPFAFEGGKLGIE